MNTFDNNSAQQSMDRYFPEDVQRYLYNSLKPGTFHIWYGKGNTGKNSLKQIVPHALEVVYNLQSTHLYTNQYLTHPVNSFSKTKILVIENEEGDNYIPANRVKDFLDNGFIIILITNTLPIIQGANESLWGHTHVIPFKNPIVPIKIAYVPHNLLLRFIAAKIQEYNGILVEAPNSVRNGLEQVKFLSTCFTGAGPIEPKLDDSACAAVKALENLKKMNKPHKDCPVIVIEDSDDESVEETSATTTATAIVKDEASPYVPVVIMMEGSLGSRKISGTLTINADSESDGFVITSQEDCAEKTTLYITGDDIYDYVHMYFASITMSTAQYSSYKFTVPGFPTTIISSNNINKYISTIFVPQLDFLMKCWPETA